MNSDDWKAIFAACRPMLLAAVTSLGAAGTILAAGGSWNSALGAAFLSFSGVYLEILRRRSDDAAAAAKEAKATAADTKNLLNGRMDDLLKAERERAYAAGHAAGVATVSAAIAESPKVSMDAQGVSQAVAKTLGDSALRPKPPGAPC